MTTPKVCYVARRRVEFCDTDMAGIVHFANFYRYMEQAEHEYFRSRGLKIVDTLPDGTRISWPRVQATCSFKAPASYEDIIEIHIAIQNLGTRSLTVSYHFQRGEALLAIGEMKTVCVEMLPGHGMRSMDMPPKYRQQFEADLAGSAEPPSS